MVNSVLIRTNNVSGKFAFAMSTQMYFEFIVMIGLFAWLVHWLIDSQKSKNHYNIKFLKDYGHFISVKNSKI